MHTIYFSCTQFAGSLDYTGKTGINNCGRAAGLTNDNIPFHYVLPPEILYLFTYIV